MALINMVASLSGFVLSPFFTGPLYVSATYYPHVLRHVLESVANRLPAHLATTVLSLRPLPDSSTAITTLGVIFALGIIRKVNRTLNTAASNSWRLSPSPGWDWQNEIAVVTGGCSGIGKAISQRLASLGIRVAILDVQPPHTDLRANHLIKFYQCDVTSTSSLAAAADSLRRDFGDPSILVNNAGIGEPKPILMTDEAYLRKIMGVNLMSMWFTTQQFLPTMIGRNKGHVVTIASVSSFVALPGAADYAATKAGALAFHEALTSELKFQYKARNVLTTVVHPNFVRTPMVEPFATRLEKAGVRLLDAERIAEEVVGRIESRRGGQLVIPSHEAVITGIRGWPSWLQELLRDMVARTSVRPWRDVVWVKKQV